MYESDDKMVSHPQHYISKNGWEAIDIIELLVDGCVGRLATDLGNVIKYIARFKKKNGLQDIKKAKFYMSDIYELEYCRFKVCYTIHPEIFDSLPSIIEAVTECCDDYETALVGDIFRTITEWRVMSSIYGTSSAIEQILNTIDHLIIYEENKGKLIAKEDENDGK